MKIYFAGSIRAGREDALIYHGMVAFLRSFGEVLTGHVGDPSLSSKGNDGPDDRSIHERDMAWLRSCDLVVAEVSTPSLGVGYELGWAAALSKPVLCLHRPSSERFLSAMIAGSPWIETFEYSSEDDSMKIIRTFVNGIYDQTP